MKPTGLLTATALLVVLAGTAWWFNKHPKKETSAIPPSPKILALGEDQIQGIRIAKSGSEPVVLKKIANKWMIAEPKQIAADEDTVKSMTGSLGALNADRLIEDHPSNLAGFGLNTPAEEVDVTLKGGATDKLLIGSDTPSGSDTYVKLADKPAVYTIYSSTKSNFDKSVNDLRDKRLMPFNSDKVTAVSVAAKGPAFEFGKNAQGEWQITKPSPMRADTMQVDDLVRKLKDAKMDLPSSATPEDEKKAASEFASGANIATVTVTDNSGPYAMTIHQAKDKTYYARSSAVEGVYKLSGDVADALKDKDVDSFRNKKLFDFGFTDPTKIEINGAAYQKSGDKWTGPQGQVEAAGIQAVIDKLRDLSATRFADKMSGAQTLTMAVTAGDNHKLEKVTVNKAGEAYDAQREGEPAVYVLDAKTVEDLQKSISGIKKAAPASSSGRKP
jgi:hypothetical protein